MEGSTAQFPVMAVQGNGNSIPDGWSSPAATNNTLFGSTSAGGGTTDLSLVIINSGSSSLRIRFSPSTTGFRQAVVSIQNDDKNPFYFAISGTGSPPFKITTDSTD